MESLFFEGESTYLAPGESDEFPDGHGASLGEAFEDAAGKARNAGHKGVWFDVKIQVLTRDQNQNVKTYKVTLSGS
jgi:hypothetical protein